MRLLCPYGEWGVLTNSIGAHLSGHPRSHSPSNVLVPASQGHLPALHLYAWEEV